VRDLVAPRPNSLQYLQLQKTANDPAGGPGKEDPGRLQWWEKMLLPAACAVLMIKQARYTAVICEHEKTRRSGRDKDNKKPGMFAPGLKGYKKPGR